MPIVHPYCFKWNFINYLVNGKLKWQHRVRQICLSSTISKVNKKSKMNFYVNEFSKSISKSLSIHASFCICYGSYPFCSCFDQLFLCFTQFCGGSLTVWNVIEHWYSTTWVPEIWKSFPMRSSIFNLEVNATCWCLSV